MAHTEQAGGLQREEALKKSEQMLEEDALRFDAFLKENDEKVQEAIKKAEVEGKAKQDKVRLLCLHLSPGSQGAIYPQPHTRMPTLFSQGCPSMSQQEATCKAPYKSNVRAKDHGV